MQRTLALSELWIFRVSKPRHDPLGVANVIKSTSYMTNEM